MQVDGADHQCEQDGLRDSSVGEPLGGVGNVDAVAPESAVEALDIRPLGSVGVLPGGVEVVAVLAELVERAESAGLDGDRGLLADPWQRALGQGPQPFALRDRDGGLGRAVCSGGPLVGEVHHGRPRCRDEVDLVEAGHDTAGEGAVPPPHETQQLLWETITRQLGSDLQQRLAPLIRPTREHLSCVWWAPAVCLGLAVSDRAPADALAPGEDPQVSAVRGGY